MFRFFVAGQPDEGPIVLPGQPLEGDTRFVGDACTATAIPAATPGVNIAVAERGTCTFQVKTQNAESRGYTGVVIFNNVTGGPPCDQLLNMDFTNYTGDAVALFVARSVGMRLIGAHDITYRCTPGNPAQSTPTPAAPREGVPLSVSVQFDGWGYAHLYRTGSNKLEEVGTPYAIPESLDEAYALDYGDLSIHEWATDPDRDIAYTSYYAGGVRVVSFGESGIQQVGCFIDEGGSNFWGIEQFTTAGGQRLIAASDRDFGLYILRYTGSGQRASCTPTATPPAPVAATPTPTPTPTPTSTPAAVAARDTVKPRISLLSNSRQSIKTLRGKGLSFRVSVDEAATLKVSLRGRFTSTLRRGARGKAQKLARRDGTKVNARQQVTVVVRPSAALRRKLRGEKRLPTMLSIEATDAAGNSSTRTKALTFR